MNPEAKTYVVAGVAGESPRVFPNFDNWSEIHGMATTQRQMEVEREHFGTILFKEQSSAIAAAMNLSAPDDHKTAGACDCKQCEHYKMKALVRETTRSQPEIEI